MKNFKHIELATLALLIMLVTLLVSPGVFAGDRGTPEAPLMAFQVRLVHHKDTEALNETYRLYMERAGQLSTYRATRQRDGFTAWVGDVCELHYIPAKNEKGTYKMGVLGHELEHCSRGQYHSEERTALR